MDEIQNVDTSEIVVSMQQPGGDSRDAIKLTSALLKNKSTTTIACGQQPKIICIL